MSDRAFCAAAFLFILCLTSGSHRSANAAPPSTGGTAATADTTRGDGGGIDEGSSPGLELAREHLAALLPLLAHLRDHEPEQYEKAIRDLDRAAKRLETLRRRDEGLYEVALREWQTRGRVDLLKARLRVRRSDADARQLLAQMQQLRKIEIERVRRERDLLQQRHSLMTQRAAQAQQVAVRSARQIEELDRQLKRLVSQPLDADSPAYQRALGAARNRSAGRPDAKSSTDSSAPAKKSRPQ